MLQLGFFQTQLGQPRLKVNGHGCAIFLGLLHVVHMDVVAKDCPRIAILARYRRASKGHKGGVRQGITQMLGVAHLIRKALTRDAIRRLRENRLIGRTG